MKTGRFIGLLLLLLGLLTLGLHYWDIQDGEFSGRLALMGTGLPLLGLLLLLVPGQGLVVQLTDATHAKHHTLVDWLTNQPKAVARTWWVGLMVSMYVGICYMYWLEGDDVFSLGRQLGLLVLIGVLYLVFRYWAFRPR